MREFVNEYVRTCNTYARNKMLPPSPPPPQSALFSLYSEWCLTMSLNWFHGTGATIYRTWCHICVCRPIYEDDAFYCNKFEHHGKRNDRLVPEKHFQELQWSDARAVKNFLKPKSFARDTNQQDGRFISMWWLFDSLQTLL